MRESEFLLFIKKVMPFIALIVVLDIFLGKIQEFLYFESNTGSPEYHLAYSLEKADDDIMVFGSSRAQHHYDPEFFEKEGKTFYNTGEDGQGIYYSYAILKSLLARSQKSKIIILDINPNEFSVNQESLDRLSVLLPYYYKNKHVRSIVNERSKFEKIKVLSSLYRYNSQFISIINNLFQNDSLDLKDGFEPIDEASIKPLKPEDYFDLDMLDYNHIKIFQQFLMDAKNQGNKVYVCVSPTYRKYSKGAPKSIEIAKQICTKEKIPFLDYSQNEWFINHPELFADPTHLNEEGAMHFSQMFAKEALKIN